MKRTRHHRKTNSVWTRPCSIAKVDTSLHHKKNEQCYGLLLPVPSDLPEFDDERPAALPLPAAQPQAAPPPLQDPLTYHKDFVYHSPRIKIQIVLHLYAGFRRPGGISDFVYAFNAYNDISMLIIPIDIVSQNERHNILDPGNFRHYLSLIANGHIVGILAGPPCETWSAARHRLLLDSIRKGPRPLRSVEFPFGMHKRTGKELAQVNVGNLLLTVAFRLFVEMIASGGFALIEHPADAGANFASIFKLPITQRLLAIPCVRKETFFQGLLGQISPKPTTILTLHFASLKSDRMPPPLAQRDSDGAFATSAAKTYRPRFCALIAAMILDTVHKQSLDELRHAFFMREVVSRFKAMNFDVESYSLEDVVDFVPYRIDQFDIPLVVHPLLDWISVEQVHGPDYHGPLPLSS